ncbi:ankyrin repeat domain-containing protein [Aspergillus undulatus]|uniref:ankyrin repeat domain-containing protein n=1 Tax=Aspergillus undulatus TaxID=1810928 RepID=UPI003CCCAA4A
MWKPSPFSLSHYQQPLAICAASKGYSDVLKMLLDHGVDPNSVDAEYNMTLLGWASYKGHIHIVRLTVLSYAAAGAHLEVVRHLLDAGAVVNHIDHEDPTPFFRSLTADIPEAQSWERDTIRTEREMAIKEGTFTEQARARLSTAALLLERGANRDQSDYCGRSVFSYVASSSSYPESLLQSLLEQGWDLGEVDSAKRTAFSWACEMARRMQRAFWYKRGGTLSKLTRII